MGGGPTPVDGIASANTLLGFSSVQPGYCLKYVWNAYKYNGAYTNGAFPTAYSGWLGSAGQRPGDWNPPAGVPVYFGPKPSSDAGDVVISLGNGECAATDWPYNGVTGRTTLAKRQQQIGRPFLGWTETILNFPILQAQPNPTRKVGMMTTLYARNDTDNPSAPATGWAVAGDGENHAAWLEIGDPDLANRFAANTLSGSAIFLSNQTWNAWRNAYLSAWE